MVELLAGRFDESVMTHVCRQGTGLFPAPAEMAFECTCPDGFGGGWLCKHLAATLYGVGVRLDEDPELLFRLRRVAHADLLARRHRRPGRHRSVHARRPPRNRRRPALRVFGIDLEAGPAPRARRSRPPRSR